MRCIQAVAPLFRFQLWCFLETKSFLHSPPNNQNLIVLIDLFWMLYSIWNEVFYWKHFQFKKKVAKSDVCTERWGIFGLKKVPLRHQFINQKWTTIYENTIYRDTEKKNHLDKWSHSTKHFHPMRTDQTNHIVIGMISFSWENSICFHWM